MRYDDEKDYIMRMIKEVVAVLISLLLGKKYVQVELTEESNSVAGTVNGHTGGNRKAEYP